MTFRDLALRSRPIAYWRPGDVPPGVPSGTTIRDQTGHEHAGTTVSSFFARGTSLYVGGGNALDTTAVGSGGDRIYVPWPSTPLSAFSFEAVVRFAAFASTPTLISQDDGSTRTFQWRVETNGRLNLFYWGDGGIAANTDTTPLTAGVCHHIVSTATGSAIAHYIDGQLRSTVNVTFTMQPPSGPIILANRGTSAWQPFRGLMSDIAVYGRALRAAEIKAHYAALRPALTRRPLRR